MLLSNGEAQLTRLRGVAPAGADDTQYDRRQEDGDDTGEDGPDHVRNLHVGDRLCNHQQSSS